MPYLAKNLAQRICGVCPQILSDSQSMYLKRQNGLVLPSTRAKIALVANALRKAHLFSGHYSRTKSKQMICSFFTAIFAHAKDASFPPEINCKAGLFQYGYKMKYNAVSSPII
ncbi:hypothetical protein U6B65_03805 [Oscillospiraceae bacterium MB08-C2-2]|nr:hypothetical protein U6B65_03805 [Oscillospiraceae bacterium MB08-C2-2]